MSLHIHDYLDCSVDGNMILHTHSSQELDELILCESGWPSFQHMTLEGLSGLDSHPSDFLAPDPALFGGSSPFETPSFPAFITHDTPEPFQCTDQDMTLQLTDSQFYGSSHDSGRTTVVSSPAHGRVGDIGSAMNDNQPTVDSSSVSTSLQNAFASMEERDDIAEIGATICSLVADHLKRLSGLSTTRATATLLPTRNEPLLAPATRTSSRILVDFQGHRGRRRSSKTQKAANSGVKHAKDRVIR